MNDLPGLAAQPRPLRVRVDGAVREYLIHPLTIDDFAALQVWIDRQFPDPFDVVSSAIAKGDYTVAQQQYLLDRALVESTRGRHAIGTPEGDRMLFSLEGTVQMLLASIRKGDPSFSEDDARTLRKWLSLADLQALYVLTGAALVTGDPKAPTTTSAGSGSSASPAPRRRRSRAAGGASTTRR